MSVEVGRTCSDEVIRTSVEVGSGTTDESDETEGVAYGSDVEVISAFGSDVVVVSHQLVVVVSMLSVVVVVASANEITINNLNMTRCVWGRKVGASFCYISYLMSTGHHHNW